MRNTEYARVVIKHIHAFEFKYDENGHITLITYLTDLRIIFLFPLLDKGGVILDHILKVQIPGVMFDQNTGDSLVSRYDVLNYRQPGSGSCSNEHCYTPVTNFSSFLFER